MRGEATVTSSISLQALGESEARSINDVRGSVWWPRQGSTGLLSSHIIAIIGILLLSSCDAALEPRKGCAKILADWLQRGLAYAHPSSQARTSVASMARERWGHSRGHEPHESSTEETHGQPSMCACVQVREEEYLSSDSAPSMAGQRPRAAAAPGPRARSQAKDADRSSRPHVLPPAHLPPDDPRDHSPPRRSVHRSTLLAHSVSLSLYRVGGRWFIRCHWLLWLWLLWWMQIALIACGSLATARGTRSDRSLVSTRAMLAACRCSWCSPRWRPSDRRTC